MSKVLESLGRKGKELLKKTMMGTQAERTAAQHAQQASAYQTTTPAHSPPPFNIVVNPAFGDGTQGWFGLGCNLSLGTFGGKTYCIAHDRKNKWEGLAQEITERVEVDVDYQVEAWVGIGDQAGEAEVICTVKTEKSEGGEDFIWIGSVSITKGKWSLFSGKLRISKLPAKAILYFEGPSPGVDILVSSVAVIPLAPQSQVGDKGMERFQAVGDQENLTLAGNSRMLVQNSGFTDGLKGWRAKNCNIYVSESLENGRILPSTGKFFAVAGNRTEGWQGIEQEITGRIEESMHYTVTCQVRIRGNVAEAHVLATLYLKGMDNKDQYITLAKGPANNSKWTELKGDFIVNKLPKVAVVYLEGPPGGVDLLVDNFAMFVPVRARPTGPPALKDPRFGANIIDNTNFEGGLGAWYPMGNCRLTITSGSPVMLGANAARSFTGSPPPGLHGRYVYASNRTQVWEGPGQTITEKLQLFNTYQVTAWVATALPSGSHGVLTPQRVNVALGVDGAWVQGGEVYAGTDWTEVSGSIRLEKNPEKVIVYFQGPAPGIDMKVAGLHIFAVDRLARVPYLKEKTDQVRKCDVVVRLQDSNGRPLPPGIPVSIQQTKNSFPLGTCISQWNLANKGYTKFFVEQFNWAVFDNEIKWGWTEPNQGQLKYEEADEMVELCNRNGILMRGHCIIWETEDTVQDWLKKLDAQKLAEAVQDRVSGLLTRYHGQFKHYDVNNEMLHGSFYKDKLGPQFWPYLFQLAHQFDPQAILFVNDYHVEDGEDSNASPQKYIEHIRDLQSNGAPIGGIGIQGHLNVPIGPIIEQALNELSTVGLPIWFTEVDVESVNEYLRADDFEVILREAYAHPSVEGFMLWGFWEGSMCRKNSHLVDSDKRVNECGQRFIALKKEWLTSLEGVTDQHGQIQFRGFQGEYTLTMQGRGVSNTFNVTKGNGYSVVDLRV
ncbi:unnamed protein product [Calypogeia fissa]